MNHYDDDAVLRDALAFIDTFDDNNTSDTPIDVCCALDGPSQLTARVDASVPSSSNDLKGTALTDGSTRRRNRSSWYQKQRTELEALKELAVELEYRLAKLRERTKNHPIESADAILEVDNGSLVVGVWREVVRRQFKQRQRAEHENLRLKKLLREQMRIVQAIERLFTSKRTSDAQAFVCTDTEDVNQPGVVLAFVQATNLFLDLFASIDGQYLATDRILTKIQGMNLSENHYDVRIVPDSTMGLILETIEHRILPFPYEITVEAAWESVSQATRHGPHHIEKTAHRRKLHAQVGTLMKVYLASHKYVEPRRTVLVSAGISDSHMIPGISVEGVHMRHEAWSIVEPLPSTERALKHATRVTTYIVGIPVTTMALVKDTHATTRKKRALVEFFAQALKKNQDHNREQLENRLLEYSVRRIETVAESTL